METTLLSAPIAAPRPAPTYPTLCESWAIVGWYLLATQLPGGACYALLRYTTSLPRMQIAMAASVTSYVSLLAFLR